MTSRPISDTLETIERIRGNLESMDLALDRAKVRIRHLSSRVIEPLNREDFPTEEDFRRAAQTESLKIITTTMSQQALDAIETDEFLTKLRNLDDEKRDRLDELARQYAEQMKEILGPSFADYYPTA